MGTIIFHTLIQGIKIIGSFDGLVCNHNMRVLLHERTHNTFNDMDIAFICFVTKEGEGNLLLMFFPDCLYLIS